MPQGGGGGIGRGSGGRAGGPGGWRTSKRASGRAGEGVPWTGERRARAYRGRVSVVDGCSKFLSPDLVVVFGPNAAGKSNLLEALVLLSRLVRERTLADALIGSESVARIRIRRKNKQSHPYEEPVGGGDGGGSGAGSATSSKRGAKVGERCSGSQRPSIACSRAHKAPQGPARPFAVFGTFADAMVGPTPSTPGSEHVVQR